MIDSTLCPNYQEKLEAASVLFTEAANAIRSNAIPRKALVWLELTGCAGNIISLLDGANPNFEGMITELVDVVFDNSVMAAQGEGAMEKLFSVIGQDYILAVEGAVSTANDGIYTIIGNLRGEPVSAYRAIKELGENAEYVISVGTCASDGGISAAYPNPARCVGIQDVLDKKVVKLPGCPCHPDWFLGTLSYILLYGEPPLDSRGRPLLFYSTLIHDCCPRRPFFERGIFASELGEHTCMLKMGCRGPITRTACPVIQWNNRTNWPIGDNSPCIGCAMFGFPDQMQPFISYHVT